MEFRGMMGGFYKISEWIMRLSVINVLWIVFSIPFFFLLITTLVATDQSTAAVQSSLLVLGIVSPFTFVPATAAVFGVARKWIMGDEDVPLFKTYMRTYRQNYLQSMLGSLIFLVLGALFIVNYRFYMALDSSLSVLSYLFLMFSIVMVAAFLNFLCITTHFEMKLMQVIKNAFIITLGQPFTTFSILITNGVIIFLSGRFTWLIPFFSGSLMAMCTFWYFYRGVQRIEAKIEAQREKEANTSEEEDGSLPK